MRADGRWREARQKTRVESHAAAAADQWTGGKNRQAHWLREDPRNAGPKQTDNDNHDNDDYYYYYC